MYGRHAELLTDADFAGRRPSASLRRRFDAVIARPLPSPVSLFAEFFKSCCHEIQNDLIFF